MKNATLKVLHLPLNVAGSEQVGQERGFREVFDQYVQFDFVNYAGANGNADANRELLSIVEREKPNIIFAQLQQTEIITKETLETIRRDFPSVWLTTWSGDARDNLPTELIGVLPSFDIFYSCTDQEEMYSPHCQQYAYMPIAVDVDEVTPKQRVATPKIIFIGNHFGYDNFPNSNKRVRVMEALSREFGSDFGVYGFGWPNTVNHLGTTPIKSQADYYNSAEIVISIDHFNDLRYFSERRLWAIASGSVVMLERHKGVGLDFPALKNLILFDDIDDLVAKIRALTNTDKSQEGYEFVVTNHNWAKRAETVKKDYLEGIKMKKVNEINLNTPEYWDNAYMSEKDTNKERIDSERLNYLANAMRDYCQYNPYMSQEQLALLDVGCGNGEMLRKIHAMLPFWRLAGVDIAPETVKLAQSLDGFDYRVASAYELPYGDGSFPIIFCGETLEHLEEPDKAIAEMMRVLRDGGYLVCSVPCNHNNYSDEHINEFSVFDAIKLTCKDNIQSLMNIDVKCGGLSIIWTTKRSDNGQ